MGLNNPSVCVQENNGSTGLSVSIILPVCVLTKKIKEFIKAVGTVLKQYNYNYKMLVVDEDSLGDIYYHAFKVSTNPPVEIYRLRLPKSVSKDFISFYGSREKKTQSFS